MQIDPTQLSNVLEEPINAATALANVAGQVATALANGRRNLKIVAEMLAEAEARIAAAEKTIAERDAEIAKLKAPPPTPSSDKETRKERLRALTLENAEYQRRAEEARRELVREEPWHDPAWPAYSCACCVDESEHPGEDPQ